MLSKSAFHYRPLQLLFHLSELAFHPLVWTVNQFTTSFLLSTKENSFDKAIVIKRLIHPFLIIVFVMIFSIPALLGVILRCALHLFKNPYILSEEKSFHPPSINERRSSITVPRYHLPSKQPKSLIKNQDQTFTISSANVCLLPELLSRINNLTHTENRATEIGEKIVVDQFFYQNSMDAVLSTPATRRRHSQGSKSADLLRDPGHNILTHFPRLDFLCLQETWDRDYSRRLMSELHKVFPWIIHDVGISNLFVNRFSFNSGLMVASKHEILEVDFKPFSHSWSQCDYNSKGLLMVKVELSSTEQHEKVGYIFATHLQAYQGKQPVIQKQLDEILDWTERFRHDTAKTSDVVVFDILCGDFNFDNMSPVDEPLQKHRIFDVYDDICRDKTGKDRNWTIGTEMRQMTLWDSQVSTPEGLKQALEDPVLRHRHIIDGNLVDGTMKEICGTSPSDKENIQTKLNGVAGRRRIDYILYRKDTPVIVQNFSFITRLATLTDHIPVSMTFTSSQ